MTSTKNAVVDYIVVGMPSEDEDSQGSDDIKKTVASKQNLEAKPRANLRTDHLARLQVVYRVHLSNL